MKKLISLFALMAILATSNLEAAKNKYAVGVRALPSVAVIPLDKASSNIDGFSSFDPKLVTGSFTIGVDGMFKVTRKIYMDLYISTSSYTFNNEYEKQYSLSSTNISLMGITFFDKPDEFTPYLGYGVSLLFLSSKEPALESSFMEKTFTDFAIGGSVKFGFIIPIANDFVGDLGLQVDGVSQEHIFITPKILIGVSYWLD